MGVKDEHRTQCEVESRSQVCGWRQPCRKILERPVGSPVIFKRPLRKKYEKPNIFTLSLYTDCFSLTVCC